MKVNICGIPHNVIEKVDSFDKDIHFGMIDYINTDIIINKNLSPSLKKNVVMHEMIHGILTHLGYTELSNDEIFVNSFASALAMAFDIKVMEDDEEYQKCENCKHFGLKEDQEPCVNCKKNYTSEWEPEK